MISPYSKYYLLLQNFLLIRITERIFILKLSNIVIFID